MLVTLSERVMSEVVRNLEGLDPAITLEEITERMPEYSKRLFDYVGQFGVRFLSCLQVRGQLADFRFQLIPNGQDNRDSFTQGLAIMRPVCISVEESDLGALVLNPAMLAGFRGAWQQIGPTLQRISPNQLLDKIEAAAGMAMSAPAPYDEDLGGDPDVNFLVWCQLNGLKPPAEAHRRRELAAAQEAREAEQRRRETVERTFRFDGQSDFKVRE